MHRGPPYFRICVGGGGSINKRRKLTTMALNPRLLEGGVVGVLGGFMIFRAALVKSETTFVKQNRKLVYKCGLRFYWRGAEHVKRFDLSSVIEVLGPRFEKLRFIFGLFRGAPPKSKTTFVNQLSISFTNVVSDFTGAARKITLQIPLLHPRLLALFVKQLMCAGIGWEEPNVEEERRIEKAEKEVCDSALGQETVLDPDRVRVRSGPFGPALGAIA